MSGKPFVEVQVAAEQRALLVARREVIQGVMLKCEGGMLQSVPPRFILLLLVGVSGFLYSIDMYSAYFC